MKNYLKILTVATTKTHSKRVTSAGKCAGAKEIARTVSLSDGMYYELTYNGDKNELYLDAYKKWENQCIKL